MNKVGNIYGNWIYTIKSTCTKIIPLKRRNEVRDAVLRAVMIDVRDKQEGEYLVYALIKIRLMKRGISAYLNW